MAIKIFRGDTAEVAQNDYIQIPGDILNGDSIRIEISNKSIEYVCVSTGDQATRISDMATGLATAFNASVEAEFNEVTATADTTGVLLSSVTAGTPYEFTVLWKTSLHVTETIAFDATAAVFEDAMETLPQVVAGDISVAGSAGGPYTLTFGGLLTNQNLPLVELGTNALTGPGVQGVEIINVTQGDSATDEVQKVTLTGTPTGGTFTLEMYTSSVTEVQTISINNTPTGGTFRLTYDTQQTGTIAFDATAATIQTDLEALSNLSAGDVDVAGPVGGPFLVTFLGDLSGIDVGIISADFSSLTGGDAIVLVEESIKGVPGVNEKQTVSVNNATGGSFTLQIGAVVSGAIAYNASAATVDAALEAMSNVSAGDVTCTGGALPGTAVVVEFTGNFAATNMAMMVADGALLTGADSFTGVEQTAGAVGNNEIQQFTLPTFSTPPFPAIFSGNSKIVIYDPLTDNSDEIGEALDVEAALLPTGTELDNYLILIDEGISLNTADGNTLSTTPSAGDYSMQWINNYASYDVPTLSLQPFYAVNVATVTQQGSGSQNEIALATLYGYDPASIDPNYTFRLKSTSASWPLDPSTVSGEWHSYADITTGAAFDAVKMSALIATAVGYETGTLTATENLTATPAHTPALSVDIEFTASNGNTNVSDLIVELKWTDMSPTAMTTYQQGASGTNEVHRFTAVGTPASGSFTVTYNGEESGPIPYDSTAGAMAVIINAMDQFSAVVGGACTGSGGALPGSFVDLTWDGDGYQSVDVDDPSVDFTNIAISIEETIVGVDAVNEKQEVSFSSDTHAGTFTLTFGGNTTANIAYAASNATIKTELELLASIDDVTITGALPAVFVEFGGVNAATDIALMTAADALFNGTVTIAETVKGAELTDLALFVRSEGPQHIDSPGNWTGGSVPITGDKVYINATDNAIFYGMDASVWDGVLLDELHVQLGLTGGIGSPLENLSDYREYRARHWQIGATLVILGEGSGSGFGHCYLDLKATQSAVRIAGSGSSVNSLSPTISLLGTHTSNTIELIEGDVGVAIEPDDASAFGVVQRGGALRMGPGMALQSLDKTAGELDAEGISMTSVNIKIR